MARLDDVVDLQKKAVNRFSEFATTAADMTTKGNYTPSAWCEAYAKLWTDLADDMAQITKKLFEERRTK